jgi:glycogen operon protein
VTCHDGFTLQDLVSYDHKHNEANDENNRDGADDNNSWNCGVEGPTDDEHVLNLREQQKRNLVATLFFSQGVPMIRAGDELSQTKDGNNNTYCLDNELTWANWNLGPREEKFLEFVRKCAAIWREQPVFQRRNFFVGRAIRGCDVKDISFFEPSGKEMSDQAWDDRNVRCLGVRLAGDVIDEVDERGEPIIGDTLLLLMNAHWEEIPFTLPATRAEHYWQTMLDTAHPDESPRICLGGETFMLHGRSLALLRTTEIEEAGHPVSSAQVDAIRREARRANQPSPTDPPLSS